MSTLTPTRLVAVTLALGLVAGCKQEPVGPPPDSGVGGLAVDSTRPAAGATEAPYAGRIYVYFDRALDPTTVTEGTVGVVAGSITLPGRVTYDDARHAAVIDVAMAPAVDYRGIATIAIRGVGGEGLDSNFVWSFRARSTAREVIDPASASGASPVVAVDGAGTIHVAYLDSVAAVIRYGRCDADCGSAASWALTTVATDPGPDSRLDLVASAAGELALAYYVGSGGALAVSTCAQACTAAAGWQTVVLDAAAGDAGYAPSLARAGDGALHVLYQERGAESMRYVTCPAGCGAAAAWSPPLTVDPAAGRGPASDIGVTSTGGVHAVWVANQDAVLVYGFCPASCASLASWIVTPLVTTAGVADRVSLGVDDEDRPVVLFGVSSLVAVGICVSTACNSGASWSLLGPLVSDAADDTRPTIAVDPAGRLHAVYATRDGALRYLACTALCEFAAAQWVAGTFSSGSDWLDAGIALDPSGVPVVAARSRAGGLSFVR